MIQPLSHVRIFGNSHSQMSLPGSSFATLHLSTSLFRSGSLLPLAMSSIPQQFSTLALLYGNQQPRCTQPTLDRTDVLLSLAFNFTLHNDHKIKDTVTQPVGTCEDEGDSSAQQAGIPSGTEPKSIRDFIWHMLFGSLLNAEMW